MPKRFGPQDHQRRRREDDVGRGPGWLQVRRQSRKLLLDDLKTGFDQSEVGARPSPSLRLLQLAEIKSWRIG